MDSHGLGTIFIQKYDEVFRVYEMCVSYSIFAYYNAKRTIA